MQTIDAETIREAGEQISQWPQLIQGIKLFAEQNQCEHAQDAIENLYESWRRHSWTALAAESATIEATGGELCISGGERSTTWMLLVNGLAYRLLRGLFSHIAMQHETDRLRLIDRGLTNFDPALVGKYWESARAVIAEFPELDWTDLACEVRREATLTAARVQEEIENFEGAVKHSPDFASVNWGGTVFGFTTTQAACVKVLYEARTNGTPIVGEAAILEAAEATSALRSLFDGHPAWRTMIVSPSRGRYMLQEPAEKI